MRHLIILLCLASVLYFASASASPSVEESNSRCSKCRTDLRTIQHALNWEWCGLRCNVLHSNYHRACLSACYNLLAGRCSLTACINEVCNRYGFC
ncbi:hypothetical protein P9112_014666 [Eukaryota sp. TZLM1-RC]